MKRNGAHESYPLSTVLLSTLLALSIYAIGVYLFFQLGAPWAVLFALYCAWIELRILRHSCRHCWYYDKVCGLGRGRICSLLFKKGDPGRFTASVVNWSDLVPDFLVTLLPLIAGIIVSIREFRWLIPVLMAALLLLSFVGNAIVRGTFVCKYCKQKQLGCPAERLFSGEGKESQ